MRFGLLLAYYHCLFWQLFVRGRFALLFKAPFSYPLLTSLMTSSLTSGSGVAGFPIRLVRVPAPYFVELYIAKEMS